MEATNNQQEKEARRTSGLRKATATIGICLVVWGLWEVPTDNSAGNFVKIQQRVPVRIDLIDLSDEDNRRLAAGMMCVVKADL